MSLELTITADKTTINLGETVTVTYYSNGAYDTTIQADNMTNAVDLGGPGEISGTMKFLPVYNGVFNINLVAYGVVTQSKGIDGQSNPETNCATVSVTVN
jgi:hypothetical protein